MPNCGKDYSGAILRRGAFLLTAGFAGGGTSKAGNCLAESFGKFYHSLAVLNELPPICAVPMFTARTFSGQSELRHSARAARRFLGLPRISRTFASRASASSRLGSSSSVSSSAGSLPG